MLPCWMMSCSVLKRPSWNVWVSRPSKYLPWPSIAARYADRGSYEDKVRAAAADVVGQGFLLPEDVDPLVREAGGLYDRIMAHDAADPSCRYLFGR